MSEESVLSIEGTAWPANWPQPGANGPMVIVVGRDAGATPVAMRLILAKPAPKRGRPCKPKPPKTAKPRGRPPGSRSGFKLPRYYTTLELVEDVLIPARKVPPGKLEQWCNTHYFPHGMRPKVSHVRYWFKVLKDALEDYELNGRDRLVWQADRERDEQQEQARKRREQRLASHNPQNKNRAVKRG
jgi:hypothetical protein